MCLLVLHFSLILQLFPHPVVYMLHAGYATVHVTYALATGALDQVSRQQRQCQITILALVGFVPPLSTARPWW